MGIKPSFYSRVSSQEVLKQAEHPKASLLLQKRQLTLLGKVLRSPEGHPLRMSSFIPGTNHPRTEQYVRRRGRPHKEWVRTMMSVAVNLFGDEQSAIDASFSQEIWMNKLHNHYGPG